MARIPEHDIEQIKNEVSVERLVASAGVALAKSGKDRIGTCPFHEDGEPSLVVTPAKNLWHCFGCQIGGGPIDWVKPAGSVPTIGHGRSSKAQSAASAALDDAARC